MTRRHAVRVALWCIAGYLVGTIVVRSVRGFPVDWWDLWHALVALIVLILAVLI